MESVLGRHRGRAVGEGATAVCRPPKDVYETLFCIVYAATVTFHPHPRKQPFIKKRLRYTARYLYV